MKKKSAMQIAREMDQELKDKGITATFKTDSGESTIGAEATSSPAEHAEGLEEAAEKLRGDKPKHGDGPA